METVAPALPRPGAHTLEAALPSGVALASMTSTEGWEQQREMFAALLKSNPVPGLPMIELEEHFRGMPPWYWTRITEAELIWDLQVVQERRRKAAALDYAASALVVAFRNYPADGKTKVVICTQDRLGLLAELAGYFSALRLNIKKAEVYTRADGVVLDVFWIQDEAERGTIEPERLKHLTFLIEGRLENPPRFASTWVGQSHRFAPKLDRQRGVIAIDNEASNEFTIVSIAAEERLGLLHDIVEVFSEAGMNIVDAQINTIGLVAHDVLRVTDKDQAKITDPARIAALREALGRAVA
ncbi:MAG TPA: ACT domain-containing protein [Methylomirabilota bacterium]|nr:ACT domain-containing protein [Methylomirabilota bacterium]